MTPERKGWPCRPDLLNPARLLRRRPVVRVQGAPSTWRTVDGRTCEHCGEVLMAHNNQLWCRS